MESPGTNPDRYLPDDRPGHQNNGFYDYYQILRNTGSDDDESEEPDDESGADEKRELKGYTDGLHSPFGTIGQIRERTGYTLDYILWGEPWINFILEAADAPRYIRGERPVQEVDIETAEDAARLFGGKIEIL